MKTVSSVAVILFLIPISLLAQDDLPLLPDGKYVGVMFNEGLFDDDAPSAAVERLQEALAAGMNGVAVSISWNELENSNGRLTLDTLRNRLRIMQELGLRPYILIDTIDTDILVAPEHLMHPDDPTRFRDGLTFKSKLIKNRFFRVLKRTMPMIKEYGGFLVSIGNEVDIYLAEQGRWDEYREFVENIRKRIKRKYPDMGIAVTMTSEGIQYHEAECKKLLELSDAGVFNFYPLELDLTVMPVSRISKSLRDYVRFAGNKEIIFQESGCPSGYPVGSYMGSSERFQTTYINKAFKELRRYDTIRFVSFFRFVDWNEETIEYLMERYNLTLDGIPEVFVERFREWIATLGILNEDGTAKMAWYAFMRQLSRTELSRAPLN